MSLVFLSINLFALLNCIQFFNSEIVQTRGEKRVLNTGLMHLFGRRSKNRPRNHPNYRVRVTSGHLYIMEELERVSEVRGLLIRGRKITRDLGCPCISSGFWTPLPRGLRRTAALARAEVAGSDPTVGLELTEINC